MSGGHFSFNQYQIKQIADEIEDLVLKNPYGYSTATILEMEEAVNLLDKAFVYAQRIDWLVSGDDSEEIFQSRLAKELANVRRVF
jgi:hypothetical protein